MTVPALYCPIPPAMHPSADEPQERSNEWLDRFALYNSETQRNRLEHGGSGMLAAHMCPNGHEELLQVESGDRLVVDRRRRAGRQAAALTGREAHR